MADCLFCKIRDGVIGSDRVFDDDACFAIQDINPQAPLHALVIPKAHVASLEELAAEHDALVGRLVRTAAKIARDKGFASSGYRTVFNTGRDAGQTVFHVHLHVLAGRPLGWPPG